MADIGPFAFRELVGRRLFILKLLVRSFEVVEQEMAWRFIQEVLF